MRDFEDSTLWRISEFERIRLRTGSSGYASLDHQHTLLPTTLQVDLAPLLSRGDGLDVIEVLAACMRNQEPALIYFECEGLVWPVTLFPAEGLYHSPRNIIAASDQSLASLRPNSVEPPGVRPPGHRMVERIASKDCYHALAPALWALALRSSSHTLAPGIGGAAAYRALRSPAAEGLPTPGALGAAALQLHHHTAALTHIARWPGMSLERGVRLLNGLYLTSNLMVSRTHPKARSQPSASERDKWLR